MKKTLLALAITALSANAFAAPVDFDASTLTKNVIPTELAFNSTITTADTLTWNIGTVIPQGEARFVRVDLNEGSLFGGAPSLAVIGATTALVAGGANQGYAVFSVTEGGTASVPATTDAVLTLSNLIVSGKTDVTAAFGVYGNETLALSKLGALYTKAAAPYVTFGNGLVVAANSYNTQRVIDVAATPSATKFTNGQVTADIGEVRVHVADDARSYTIATDATLASLIGTASTLVVSGDFSAAKNAAGELDKTLVTLNGTAATALTANSATFAVTTALGASTPTYADLEYTVDGKSVIAPSTYSAALNIGAVAGGASTANTTVSLGDIAALAKNGSTDHVDLALSPAGAYKNFVRITNKTNVQGNVFITLFNDAGQSVTFPLSAVAGQQASLEGQASTAQMDINDIYAAAQAADTSFAVAEGRNKLRLVVDGEFASGNGQGEGISVQSYTVSKDGNSFATF